MNATELLEQQHRKVEGTFDQLEDKDRDEGQELVQELANDLAAHFVIEQEIFYPAIREVDQDQVKESFEEHSLAEVALKRLLSTRDDETFKARVSALKELIQHHVKEEEQELFPKVRESLGDERLEELGEEMQQRFEEVVERGYKRVFPKGLIATSADESQKRKRGGGARKTTSRARKSSNAKGSRGRTGQSARRRKAA
jgi:hemerythrin superfamily protein